MSFPKEKGLLIVLSGPAGCGKGTVRAIVDREKHFAFSVSITTRELRPGEIEGVHYNRETAENFKRFIAEGKMLEYTEYCGNFYGTPKKPVLDCLEKGEDMLLEIEVDGARQVKESYPEAVLIMMLPPSFKIQEERLRGRGTETEEKITKRLAQTSNELDNIDIYDYVIYNYDRAAEEAASDFLAIVRAEKCSRRRIEHIKENYYNNN